MMLQYLRSAVLLGLLVVNLSGQTETPAATPSDPLRYGEKVPAGQVGVVGDETLSWGDFVNSVAGRYQGANVGVDALNDLIRRRIIIKQMKDRDLKVTPEDIKAEYDRLDRQLQEATKGRSNIKAQIAESGRPESDFLELLKLQIALQRIVADDMKDAAGSSPGALQQQWLRAKTVEAKVEMMASKLPPNAAARVYDDFITNEEFVRHLMGKIAEEDLADMAHVLMQTRMTRKLLESRGIKVSTADVDAEFERARTAFSSNEKYQGLHFEDMIKQETGMPPERYKSSEKFFLVVASYKLGEHLVPDQEAQKAFQEDMDYYGPVFEVRHLFLRGNDDPKYEGQVRTKAQARAEVEKAKTRIDNGEVFEDLVKEISEDPNSKFKDGYFAKAVPSQFDPKSEIGRAILSMPVGAIRGPLESTNGFHLIKLQGKEPSPPLSAEIVRDIRKRRAVEYIRKHWSEVKRSLDLRTWITPSN